ncbi:TTN [Mytilus coruscus]|uniref:TTN n=1 Tax=Mytilus coruscus TaxID=42192 RepID=A0A6J8ASP1_MYTCO|nr:TTN [Mytilus coruscus]
MFKRRLKDMKSVEGSHTIFECETEKDNSAVEWFKDDVKMTGNTAKIETEEGQIFKLTIKHTRVEDRGIYRIEKNGIRSEATLEVKALFKQLLKTEHILEGSDTVFECETEKESGVVKWFNGNVRITDNTENMETAEGYIYKLTIKHASVQNSGTYRVYKNDIFSEAVLEVKALFKRQLDNITIMEGLDIQFDCETEEENSSVEWFKDNVLIKMNTKNIKMEKLPGNIHKLTISPARLKDSGRYRIEKNGINSEAVLEVKGDKVNCFFA